MEFFDHVTLGSYKANVVKFFGHDWAIFVPCSVLDFSDFTQVFIKVLLLL